MAELHRERFNAPSSPRLLAVHGITGHGRRFERLAGDWWSDRHVVSVDLRGHGSSLDAAPWSLEQHAQDLVDTLDAEGWTEPVDVVGHSFGGAVALTLLALAPGRIRRLVLLDPAMHSPGQQAFETAAATAAFAGFESAHAAVEARRALLGASGHWAVEQDVAIHLVPAENGRWRYRFRVAPVVAAWGEMARSAPSLPQRRPTLLVRATEADVCNDAFVAVLRSELGAALSEAPVECGHMVYWEAPEDTGRLVAEFLSAEAPGR